MRMPMLMTMDSMGKVVLITLALVLWMEWKINSMETSQCIMQWMIASRGKLSKTDWTKFITIHTTWFKS